MDHPQLLTLLIDYRYWIVIPLAFIEGPVVALNVGFLASLGYFSPLPMLVLFIVRDFIMDSACYGIGYFGNRGALLKRVAAKLQITPADWHLVERLWSTHPGRTMFFSKLSYGLSGIFIISGGMSGISYGRFWRYATGVSVILYGALLYLGYYFGASSYGLFSAAINDFEIMILGIVVLSVIYLVGSRALSRRLHRPVIH